MACLQRLEHFCRRLAAVLGERGLSGGDGVIDGRARRRVEQQVGQLVLAGLRQLFECLDGLGELRGHGKRIGADGVRDNVSVGSQPVGFLRLLGRALRTLLIEQSFDRCRSVRYT
jgi:hypothetical protein